MLPEQVAIEDLGQTVRARRRGVGLTQEELARRAGVSRRWLGALERGATHVELILVWRTLSELGLQLTIGGVGDGPTSTELARDAAASV